MDDKRAIRILVEMTTKYPLSKEEQKAVREAIGILSWSKLMEGYVERKKRARDKRMTDID